MNEIPKIPGEIIDAIDDNKLIIFIGAGISKLYGYPLWGEMANNLIRKCLDNKAITRSEQNTLNNSSFNSMQLVTIAYNRLKDKLGDKKAQKLLIDELSLKKAKGKEKTVEEIAKYLANYQCPILTTNADISLDKTKYFKNANIIENFSDWDRDPRYNVLFHIHGSIKNFSGMVFTSEQYAKSYMDGSNFSENLKKLFTKESTFLFIGYGVNEFELIRYLLNSEDKNRRNKFLLKNYLDSEKIKQELEKEYYDSLGIELLPYSIEEKGYSVLIDILNNWDKEVTTKTLAHMHPINDIKEALREKPNKKSIKFIKESLIKSNNKQIIKQIAESKYLNDWICVFKNNSIFSVDNIKPGIVHEDNSISSSFWEGLNILEVYSKSGNYIDEIDLFVIDLINNSISKYKNDTEKIPNKRLDSSFSILSSLSDILFSRAKYINECDSESFVSIFINSHYSFEYSIISDFCTKYFEDVNKNKVFNILITIIESDKCDHGYSLLINENVYKYITDNPYDFYQYTKLKIEKTENYFLTMGAFYLYPEKQIYRNIQDDVLIKWFKISSTRINKEILEKDINSFITAEKEHLKKAALALININFSKLNELFFDNLYIFFTDKDYYSDLCLLLNNNYNKFTKHQKEYVKNLIDKMDWGKQTKILKNHINNIIKKYDNEVVSMTETKKELEIANNINKKIYDIDDPIEDEIEEITERLDIMSYENALEYYKNSYSNSHFYQEALNKSFIKYLSKKGDDFVENNISDFDSSFLIALLDHYKDNYNIVVKICLLLIQRKYYDAYRQIVYACEKLYEKGKYDEAYSIIKNIDYSQFVLDDEYVGDSIITEIINENIFEYLDIYSKLSLKIKDAVNPLKKVIAYYIDKLTSTKLKGIIAYILPMIEAIDNKYSKELYEYCFDNYVDGVHISYLMYSISRDNCNSDTFKYILERDDFKEFISLVSENSEIRRAQCFYGCRIIACYLLYGNNINEQIKLMLQSKNISLIKDSFEIINYYLSNNKELDNKKFEKYLSLINKSIDDELCKHNYEVDQLIRELSIFQKYTKNKMKLTWEIIIKLFDYFNHYFSDETYELIKEYIDKEEDYISKIMDKYVNSYKEYLTYEQQLKKTLGLFANNKKYNEKYRIWVNKITKIKANFFDSQ